MSMAMQINKELFSCGLTKVLKEQWQVDVRLKAGDSDDEASAISAHKLILASRSEVFKKMLESDEFKTSTKELETITLSESEMKQEELEALVEFMYCDGSSTISAKVKQHARSLYQAADKYEIPYLRDICRNELLSSLNSSNALNLLELAQIPFDIVLNDAAFRTIKMNISTMVSSEEFKLFVFSNPDLALKIMKACLIGTSNGRYVGLCYSFITTIATITSKEQFSSGLAKVLKDQWQVDVQLKAGDSDDEASAISAHKLILASRSKVFKKMLESDEFKTSTNKQVETITLSEMQQEELEALVEFIYSDGSTLSAKVKQHARSLYQAADKYEIPYLRDICRNELISSLNSSNALNFLELAQIPFDKVLNDAAFSTIKTNISIIVSSEEFKLFFTSNPNLALEIIKVSVIRTSNGHCFSCGLGLYCDHGCG